MRFIIMSVVVFGCWSGSGVVVGQVDNATSREFVESRSPLPEGGQVISRSAPGVGVQTRTTTNILTAGRYNYPKSTLPNAYPAGNGVRVASLPNYRAPPINPRGQVGFARTYGTWTPTLTSGATSPNMIPTSYQIPASPGVPQAAGSQPPLQNMPPGSYQGQNLLGKQKTYRDGQPLRNFFRYVFP